MKTKVLSLLLLIGLMLAIFLISLAAAEIVTVNLHVGGATLDSVVLKFEWQRPSAVDDARLRIYVGTSLITTISLKPLPSAGTDRIETIDLKALYGIDTADEVNALKIWFQATDGTGAYTYHDWVEVQVTYIELPSMTTKTINLNPNAGKDATDTPYALTSADLDKLKTSNDVRYRSKYTWANSFSDSEYIEFEFPDITPMPNVSEDWTDTPYALTSADLAKLSASDDDRYQSRYPWASSYSDLEYIEFEFGDITIPSGATLDSVVLKFEWQRNGTIDNARLKIYNGTTWMIYTLTLPPAGIDYIETVDLKALGIDTEAEINALKIWFQANCLGAYTWHDWVKAEVKYTIPPPTYSVTFDAVATSPLPDVAGTTVIVTGTIGATPFTVTNAELPKTFTGIASGTTITYTYTDPVSSTVSGKRFRLDSVTGPSSPFSLTADTAITGNYKAQYLVSFRQTGSAVAPTVDYYIDTGPTVTGTVPFDVWVDSGKQILYTYQAIVDGDPGVRYVLTGVSPASPQTVTGPLTITGTYKIQYQVTFTQTGLDATATGTVVTIDSVTKAKPDLPLTDWFDSGTIYSYSSIVSSTVADKRFRLDSVTGPASPITSSGTVTGNYVAQYKVTFTQSGLDGTATGTVVTVAGVPKTYADLPFTTDWLDHGSSLIFVYSDPVASSASVKQFKLVSASHTSPLTVTAPTTVTGNYKTQYYLTVNTNPAEVLSLNPAAVSGQGWYESESTATVDAVQNVDKVAAQSRYDFRSWTGATPTGVGNQATVLMDGPKTATANYQLQFNITFNQIGVSPDFTGEVVSIDGFGYGVTNLPVSFWWDKDSIHTFSFSSPLIVDAGKQYVWVSTSGLTTLQSGTLTITSSGSVTGNYVVQVKYQITFNQTGVGSDFTGTIVVIDGVDYKFTDLPISFMWDAGSIHTFAFQSPLVVTPNAKQYVWTSTTGLSTLQSGSITVSTSGNVTGNYKTQYYLTVTSPYGTAGGQGWYDSGATANATLNTGIVDHGNGTRRVFINWTGDASGTNYARSNSILMDASKTAIANWKTQYLLTVLTDPAGLSPQPTRNPAGEAGPANGWWYDATTGVNLTAQTVTGYTFSYWDVDGTSRGSGVNPIPVSMNAPHTATAHYTLPLSVSISPLSASIDVGQSVTFTSTVSGGTPPYRYQWYLDGNPVSGANLSRWTYTPTSASIHRVYLKVTDAKDNTAQSETAIVTVSAVPVGGYSISLAKQTPTSYIAAYTALIALFGVALSLTKRKRK